MPRELSSAGKEELALALVLWKDFKTQGKWDVQITRQALEFADRLNVRKEYDALLIKLPPMRILPRQEAMGI